MIARNTCSPSREIAAHHHRNAQPVRCQRPNIGPPSRRPPRRRSRQLSPWPENAPFADEALSAPLPPSGRRTRDASRTSWGLGLLSLRGKKACHGRDLLVAERQGDGLHYMAWSLAQSVREHRTCEPVFTQADDGRNVPVATVQAMAGGAHCCDLS